jgi:hydroxymethylglutaryl-CoA reductase
VLNQQAETGRINALFDIELDRLKRLWGGAVPGSMGVLSAAAASAAAASAASKPPPK